MLLPITTSAQLPFRVTGQIGIGGPSETRNCMAQGYFMAGLGIQSRGPVPMSPAISPARIRFFVTARAEIFGAAGPIETCLILLHADSLPDGRILVSGHDELEVKGMGSTIAIGTGAERALGPIGAEIRVNVGAGRGQKHFRSTWMPMAGASAGVVVLDHLLVTVEQRWFRVPRWEKHFTAEEWQGSISQPHLKPAGATKLHEWQRFRAWSVGYRF
jgi:hypothetical protein